MNIQGKIYKVAFLFFVTILVFFSYKAMAQWLYQKHFFIYNKERIEKIVSTNIPNLNAYLASAPELDFVVEPKDSIYCVHEVVGEDNYSTVGGTVYLRVLCKKYDHSKSNFFEDQLLLPFAITQQRNTITHKTVSLTSFDQDIEEVFPPHIKPFVYSDSAKNQHPVTRRLYEKFEEAYP